MVCYVCSKKITSQNETLEHIIINAAGGKLKSNRLICQDCNTKFGNDIDSALAKQINPLANMLMIKRERGEPQPIIATRKSTGEKYVFEVGGKPSLIKPIIEKSIEDNKINFSISARSEEELKTILKGISKKNKSLDISEALKSAKWQEEYFNDQFHFKNEVGGKDVFRAVCKCAINYFIYKRGNPNQIHQLIPYIEGKEDGNFVWLHYKDNLYDLTPDESFHAIQLIGDSKERILYCYVDYFNSYKYLVLLNENYTGHTMKETYCFDVINTKPIKRDVKANYNRETLLDFFINKDTNPFEAIKESFNHSIELSLKLQDNSQLDSILNRSVKNSLGKHPKGAKITFEMANELREEMMKNLTPYIINKFNK